MSIEDVDDCVRYVRKRLLASKRYDKTKDNEYLLHPIIKRLVEKKLELDDVIEIVGDYGIQTYGFDDPSEGEKLYWGILKDLIYHHYDLEYK